jgi:hypothetical protein
LFKRGLQASQATDALVVNENLRHLFGVGHYYEESTIIDGGIRLPAGSLVIFDQINPTGASTEALADMVGRRYPANGLHRLSWGACDSAGANSSSTASESSVLNVKAFDTVLKSWGYDGAKLRYTSGPGSHIWRSQNTGIEAMRGMLEDARGVTRLYFSDVMLKDPSGRGIIKALDSIQYKEHEQTMLRGRNADNLDHVVDALRYLIVQLKMRGPHRLAWVQ